MTVPDKRGITFGYEASLNPNPNDAPASSDVLIAQPRFQSPNATPRSANEINQQGGAMRAYAKGGKVKSASSRADGCCQRGKTKGAYR